MSFRHQLYSSVAATAMAALAMGLPAVGNAQEAEVTIGQHGIGGVVTGPNGPEAGVWVIAETTDLPTKFAKIVVTDDQGRYLIPDLPPANYSLWVRGYGLVDSPKIQAVPGKVLNLSALASPNAGAAANYYPAIYWYSMLKIPPESQFSGPQRGQNMPDNLKIQAQWVNIVKTTGCMSCLGRAVETSIAMACFGRHWRAGIWRASTAASARSSTARQQPASIARRVGRFIPSQARSSETSRNPVASRRAITPGSISSTRSV